MKWLEDLANHCRDALCDSERERLYLRGVSPPQISAFGLGYIDSELPPLNYPGHFLAWWSLHKGELDDSYVIPLTTTLGHVLGFQFRHVDPSRRGYLDYFASKEEVALFGLYQAMPFVWETGSICLVEGAFDLLPIQRHIPQVVSTLHAGVSAAFWRVLRRIAPKIYLAWDADVAGREASYSIVRGDKAKSFDVQIVKFPNVPLRNKLTKDPNELWEAWGDTRLGVYLSQQFNPTQ